MYYYCWRRIKLLLGRYISQYCSKPSITIATWYLSPTEPNVEVDHHCEEARNGDCNPKIQDSENPIPYLVPYNNRPWVSWPCAYSLSNTKKCAYLQEPWSPYETYCMFMYIVVFKHLRGSWRFLMCFVNVTSNSSVYNVIYFRHSGLLYEKSSPSLVRICIS